MPKKLIVASDVHDDDYAFEKLCALAEDPSCLAFLYAGDLDTDNYFIQTKLRYRNFVFVPVLGNCDSPWSYQDSLVSNASLYNTVSYGNLNIFMSHGHRMLEPTDAQLDEGGINLIINGHTHIWKLYREEEREVIHLNPGSASRPRGATEASYCTIDLKDDPEDRSVIRIRALRDDRVLSEITVS